MRLFASLLAAFLLTLAFSLAPASSAPPPAIRVQCPRPPTLRLYRFEDGSAHLQCAGRTLVRVSVPG